MHLAITNHTGSRNRGAEALVSCMVSGFRRQYPTLSVSLHSNDPLYDQWRFQDAVTAYWGYPLLTPNHSASAWLNRLAYTTASGFERVLPVTLRGIHTHVQKDLRRANAVVAAGGDIFTSDYQNLRKHLAYPLMASKKPVYLCSHSIGPFTPKDQDYFCRAAKDIALISVRERDSYDYLKMLDIQTHVELTADVAFTLSPPLPEASRKWLQQRYAFHNEGPCVGVSISQGIIKYSGLDADAYYQCFAGFCDALIDAGKRVLLIPQVMERHPANNDVIACDAVLARMQWSQGVTVLSGEPSAMELKGAIAECEALVGTRTHATIAAMSQGIPTVSIAYSRKAFGIMKDVYGEQVGQALTLPVRELSTDALLQALEKAMQTPITAERLSDIQVRAERNFTLLNTLLEPS